MGSAVIGALRAVLGIDTAAFESGLTQAQKDLAKAGKNIQRIGGTITKVGAGLSLGLTAPIVAFGGKSVQAFDESAKAIAGVDAVLKSMGAQAGFTSTQLQDMAAKLQKVSTFDDDNILTKVTANMLTFGKVQGDVFKRAQQVTLDLSARLGEDLQGSAIRVGKALNDPVGGIKALTRVGVAFTDQQKAQIKQMVKVGDVAGAQKLILQELEREFGGQAAALAKTDWGKTQVAMNSFNDAMEDIGKTVRAIMPDVAKAIQKVADAFLSLPPSARSAIVVGAAVAAALGPLITVGGLMVTTFGAFLPLIGKLGPEMVKASSGTGLLAGAMRGLGAAVLFMGPWAIAIGAVALALGGLVLWQQHMVAASKEAKQQQDLLNTSLSAYEQAATAAAIATGKARVEALKDAAAKKEQALQTLNAAKAKLADAQATLAQRQAQTASTLDTPSEFSGAAALAAVNREKKAAANVAVLTGAINDAQARIAAADRIMNAKPPPAYVAPADPAKAKKGPDPARVAEREAEMADTRRQYDLERQLMEAEAASDTARVQALQDQLYLMERIEAWRRAGLTDIGALLKAEQDLTALQAKRVTEDRTEAQGKAIVAAAKAQKDLTELLIEQQKNQEHLAQLRLEHELDIARITGDPERIAALEREMEIARKTAEYRDAGMGGIDAVSTAVADVGEVDQARTKGFWRDSFKGGVTAALDGDLKGYLSSWFHDAANRGLGRALDKLADQLGKLFSQINWGGIFGGGSGGGGGNWLSSIGKAVASAFSGGAPGFAGGGSFMVGGVGGVDRNFVGFNATRGERVSIETPAQQANGVRGGLVFAPVYNIRTQDERGFARTQRQRINEQRRALDRGWV